MRKEVKRIAVALIIVVAYVVTLVMGITEKSRRSLNLDDKTSAADHVQVSVVVTNVNPVGHELTAQEFDFPKGKRINRVEAVFPLTGDPNRYPFDSHDTTLWLLMTTPAQPSGVPVLEAQNNLQEGALQSEQLTVGAIALQQNQPLPLSLTLLAAIPGVKFKGDVTRDDHTQMIGIRLHLRRANNLISVSILVNTIMTCLAMGILLIVLRLIGAENNKKVDLVPISLSIALIFGLPALRNVQPGVPPVGALCDYVSFIWAELIVAISALIVVSLWLLRSYSEARSQT